MTFTYDPALGDNLSLVRFELADTRGGDDTMLPDETINGLLTLYANDIGQTVVACIEYLIADLSSPNISADWLKVDNVTARQGFEKLLAQKRQKYGLSNIKGRLRSAYRSDG
jgi:hypothetical protein